MRTPVLILFSLLLQFSVDSFAFSAVATVPERASNTLYAAWNYETQTQADTAALEGCRVSARSSGLGKLAQRCKISLRQKVVGGGAIVCGDDGCSFGAGYETKQLAIDSVYELCTASYKNCQTKDMTAWWDEAGYKVEESTKKLSAKTCSPPAGKFIRSKTNCNNGDCIRTFENGCSIRFSSRLLP